MAAYEQIGARTPDGLKIGGATTDLIALHGVAPCDQYAHIADASDATTVITRVNLVIAALEEKGILASA